MPRYNAVRIVGPSVVDIRGRRVAWLGFGNRGISRHISFEEQGRILDIVTQALNSSAWADDEQAPAKESVR